MSALFQVETLAGWSLDFRFVPLCDMSVILPLVERYDALSANSSGLVEVAHTTRA